MSGSSAASRLAASGGVLALATALLTAASPAGASPEPAFWVSAGGASAGASPGCRTAQYTTVQSAVTAAEAQETQRRGFVPAIEICPGTYAEQLTITKSLELTAAPAGPNAGPVTIQLPASVGSGVSTGLSSTNCQATDAANGMQVPQSVIEICSAGAGGANTTGVSVAVHGITVTGPWTYQGCYDSWYGILVGGGASLSLSNSTVENIEAQPLTGCQGGVGVEIGSAPTSQIGHADLTNDTIESYQKNGITVDGPGSTADIDHVVVTGAGPTPTIAQNGIQVSFGATASVTGSTITGDNYTGAFDASSAGILAYGGGGAVCGIGTISPLVEHARFTGNTLVGNDIGIALANYDPTCTKSVSTPTGDIACSNVLQNSHGYPGGTASADANISGIGTGATAVGYQAGVSDVGDRDVICDNAISGAGYAPLDATSSLPSPPEPAFVRPIDVVSGEGLGPAIAPQVYGNTFNRSAYHPA
jgi:hypothetical protein